MPRGAGSLKTPQPPTAQATGLKVVYMPTCVTRTMGPARGDEQTEAVHDKLLSLFSKAGYEVVYPDNVTQQCCGMLFNSRGFTDAAATASSRLEEALMEASEGGKHPIVCDTSPCLATLKEKMPTELKFAMYEPVEFISKHMLDKLEFHKVSETVTPFDSQCLPHRAPQGPCVWGSSKALIPRCTQRLSLARRVLPLKSRRARGMVVYASRQRNIHHRVDTLGRPA
jgi:Fe-S oxidoreductase